MEEIFDRLKTADANGINILENKEYSKKLAKLTEYYENGQWMADYVLDEKGYIPKNLKRGVLSEDGVYNLLTTVSMTGDKEINEE